MSMTPRERWLALLNGVKPDRVPTDYWGTGEVTRRLLKELACENMDELYEKLHIDGVRSIGAPQTVQHFPGDPEADIWGRKHRRISYETGEYSEVANHPLANATTAEEIHAYPWPDPEKHDWDAFRGQVESLDGHRAVRCGGYEPFLLYCHLRGMEQSMMDLLTEPEITEAMLDHIFDYHYTVNARMFEIADGKVDLTYIAEDLGSQHGLLMGLEPIRRYLLPRQKRMADLARSHGIHIFYHTDGAAYDVIPDLIDVTGIEVLNPIQWRCPGMERERLVRDFGDKIAFHGAMDNQQTMPFGSVQDVRDEVMDNLRIFADARWICAPCHNLQAVSPTENIVAMYETIYAEGRL